MSQGLNFTVDWSDGDSGFEARCKELPVLSLLRPTQDEALRELQGLVELCMSKQKPSPVKTIEIERRAPSEGR
jgi:hypothetical protein